VDGELSPTPGWDRMRPTRAIYTTKCPGWVRNWNQHRCSAIAYRRARWWVGVDSVLGEHLAAAMALADESRNANARMLSAADENAQKSKPDCLKRNPRKLWRLAASCAANTQHRAKRQRPAAVRAGCRVLPLVAGRDAGVESDLRRSL
jgi:hypothetical protein